MNYTYILCYPLCKKQMIFIFIFIHICVVIFLKTNHLTSLIPHFQEYSKSYYSTCYLLTLLMLISIIIFCYFFFSFLLFFVQFFCNLRKMMYKLRFLVKILHFKKNYFNFTLNILIETIL